jgi:ATP-dependent DNA helicase RecQ
MLASLLQKYWGHASFRPHQREVVDHCLGGGDAFVLMATGSGKSVCYQLPALARRAQHVGDVASGGVTIVISPLISLMEDQVIGLKEMGVRACFLGSAQEDRSVEARALAGEFALVYLTPEKACGWVTQLQQLNGRGGGGNGIVCIAVDECHCCR